MSARKFQRQLAAFSTKVEADVEDAIGEAILETGVRIIERTPVDTGRARGGWQTTIGSAPSAAEPDRDPGDARGELEQAARSFQLGDEVHISNAVEYIGILEDGNSAQAPQGMVKVTASEWPAIVEAAVRRRRR